MTTFNFVAGRQPDLPGEAAPASRPGRSSSGVTASPRPHRRSADRDKSHSLATTYAGPHGAAVLTCTAKNC